MNRLRHVWRLVLLMAAMTLLLAGCGSPQMSALIPKGDIAADQLWLITFSLFVMLFVVLVVFIIFTYVLIRFRRKPGQEDVIPKQVEGSHKLEIIWTVIPILLLIVLAVPTVIMTFDQEKALPEGEALKIKVTANQYWWEFEYPDQGIVTSQELRIPVDQWVELEITSKDVKHSFWVPSLAGKMDANPGQITKMKFIAREAGVYEGECAELCGPSHALMYFKVVAEPSTEFNSWVAAMTAPPAAPATDLAVTGEEVFKTAGCIACHAVSAQGPSGAVGPNLAGFGDRDVIAGILEKNEENLANWLRNPQKEKPGNKMPNLNLSEDQIDALTEYLMNLNLK